MSLLACPDCGGNLGRNAEKCRCGWKRASIALPSLKSECAHEGCVTPAVIREKLPTGWANLCEHHWIAEATKQSNIRNEAKGLYTTEQRIAYCRAMLGNRMPRMELERQPGQDDEELAA